MSFITNIRRTTHCPDEEKQRAAAKGEDGMSSWVPAGMTVSGWVLAG